MRRDSACSRTTPRAGAALSAALMVVVTAGFSHAQTVTLRSSDGGTTMTGPLIRFDGSTYAIKSGNHDEVMLPARVFRAFRVRARPQMRSVFTDRTPSEPN
jgi:hypothetical protein